MKNNFHFFRTLLAICIIGNSISAMGQKSIENEHYRVELSGNFRKQPSFTVTHKHSKLTRTIIPRLQLIFTPSQPELTGSSMDGQPGIISWKNDKGTTQDISELGSTSVTAQKYVVGNKEIKFQFSEQSTAKPGLIVKFVEDQEAPVFEISLEARRTGHFSLGFTGMPEVDSSAIDFVYQPLSWTWKRFPSRFALTEEAYANTAAVFTNHDGYSEGLAVRLSDIPYRYALAAQWNNAGKKENKFWSVFPANGPKANSLFGMAVRNKSGKAQPAIYAPLPGTDKAKLNKGEQFRIGLVYLLHPGSWEKGSSYLLSSIFKYRTERQNARVSLNETLDNMLGFAMNDNYSGWNETLKASNYQFDVPGTVKNVSALHPLSLAMITDNEEILRRRALPMIEYVMSREKFLYSTSDTPGQAQVPSHLLNGPCVDIGELTALDELTKGSTPAFTMEANRLFGKPRQLNMSTETGGGSWPDYLARYRMYRKEVDLKKAVEGADKYLKQVYHQYSRTFFDSPGLRDRGAGFTTDYGFRIYDLFELFLETKDKQYLEAALTGARQLLLWTRSNPRPPSENILVNKGGSVDGIFPGRRASALEGSVFVPSDVRSQVPEQEIPAWQTSLNGLIPEAPSTYAFGPVMLAHHAAWLLRLAHYGNDTLLRDAAYNAVLGRYASFPGYYFTSLHTDVYQRFDYAMHPFERVGYNAIFYNHVWPHISLLVDFLVSDFYYRSQGKIDFPGTYAPGYAFLTSQVYGAKKGKVMGHDNVQLWMPERALKSSGIALNYLMGYNEQDLFVSFANTSDKEVTEQVQLNADVIPWSANRAYKILRYDNGAGAKELEMKQGRLNVTVPPGGLATFCIKGLRVKNTSVASRVSGVRNRFVRYRSNEDSTAKASAMIIQPNEKLAVLYAFTNKTEKEWKSCTFRYKINDSSEWTTVVDDNYPFEFDTELAHVGDRVTLEMEGVTMDGKKVSFPAKVLNTDDKSFTILGLGDSITEGGPQFHSYLFALDSMLKKAGYRPEFVGSRESEENGKKLHNAGFSGKTAEFLAKHIDSIYRAFPADIVLLHAGHNHFQDEAPIKGIIGAQRKIIDAIKKINPAAEIFVAAVIRSGKLPKYEYIPELNMAIKRLVDSLNDPAIHFVDQNQAWQWKTHAISDKVHPNRDGANIIAANWFKAIASSSDSLLPAKELSVRGGLPDFFSAVEAHKPVKVAFLGGSITRAGNGYRDQIMEWFRQQYPGTKFEEIMAAVSGTGSDFGATRVKSHVIDHQPDLVFVEFAVNDNPMRRQLIRETMEGIIRQIWKANAKTDICFVYTFSKENLEQLKNGIFPPSVSAMEELADHYHIPSIHMGLKAVDKIRKGDMLMLGKRGEPTAVPLFSIDGVHPLPETGHKIYTEVLAKNLIIIQNSGSVAKKHTMPPALEENNWEKAGMVSLEKQGRFKGNWGVTDSVTKGREYYELIKQVHSTSSADASLTVEFTGTRFGIADIMGPGTSSIEITIDDQAPRLIKRFDAFCTYYRLNYVIISDLPAGRHTATLRLKPGQLDKAAILKTRNVVIKDPKIYENEAMYIGAILY